MSTDNKLFIKLIWVAIFSISMGFVESAVVVYLRRIYYPEGFLFPLKPLIDNLIEVEVLREAATITPSAISLRISLYWGISLCSSIHNFIHKGYKTELNTLVAFTKKTRYNEH